MNEVEVRIRLTSEATGSHLMKWDPSRLDELIPLLTAWGVDADAFDGDVISGYQGRSQLAGQFRYDGSAAYFEVLIEDI